MHDHLNGTAPPSRMSSSATQRVARVARGVLTAHARGSGRRVDAGGVAVPPVHRGGEGGEPR